MSLAGAKELLDRLGMEAKAAGYTLNPDEELVLDLMAGLLANEQRFGYLSCPCRLAEGTRELDRDIICPCDYRDPDLEEHGACYCALYVSGEVATGKRRIRPVPERRGSEPKDTPSRSFSQASLPVWRCKVCGYLCARPEPPLKCPICKADKDRFDRFS